MKRKLLTSILIFTLSMSVIACENKAETSADGHEYSSDLSETVTDDSDENTEKGLTETVPDSNYDEESAENSDINNVEGNNNEYTLYPSSVDWDNYEDYEQLVQVDDVFYVFGSTLEEVCNLLDNSSETYSYNLADIETVNTQFENKEYTLPIYKNDVPWVYLKFVGIPDSKLETFNIDGYSLNEIQLIEVQLTDESLKYTYFFKDISYIDIANMNYSKSEDYFNQHTDLMYLCSENWGSNGETVVNLVDNKIYTFDDIPYEKRVWGDVISYGNETIKTIRFIYPAKSLELWYDSETGELIDFTYYQDTMQLMNN